MPFCPRCGLHVAEFDEETGAATVNPAQPGATVGPAPPDLVPTQSAAASQPSLVDGPERGWPSDAARRETTRPLGGRGLRVPPGLLVVLIVLAGLVVIGILPRPQIGGAPPAGGQATLAVSSGLPTLPALASGVPAAPAVPIVAFAILSPTDGQAVASKDLVIIGTAPPGLTVTQDISFGLDQHAKVDGTGHWAISVGLNEGDNKLTFRIGDDHSTQQTIRVIYTPQKKP
jgi:hypothetical protein